MTDCLIIGFNDSNFGEYVDMVRGMGTDSGGFRDLRLAYLNYEGKPYRSLDLLTRFYYEGRPGPHRTFTNTDFLWPVVTYLGTYLSRRGLTFDYVNLPAIERDKLKEKLADKDLLTVAITTTLYVSMHPILELISFIREHNERVTIIVGGPYISNQPKLGDPDTIQRLLSFIGADIYVISSEGEAALVNVIQALKAKDSLDKVDNIAYRDGGRYVFTDTSIESNPLEENMVDYGLFPRSEINEFITTRTAKSCPFSCSFCGFPARAGKYKYLPVELVERELNAIREIGHITTITFIDDTFNVPKERFKEILRMMIRNNYGFKWNSFYRSDHGDEEAIELMGKAGCEGVFLGVESGSDVMLKRMNKTARQKDYAKAIPLLRDAGITTHANIIVGFPGETYETVQESIDMIESARPDFYRAQLWYADPVTPIWNKKEEYGVQGSMFNWSHDTMDCHTASDLVEKMFVGIENSIWLPQNGFEQWSTFYLQRRGMSLDQLKTFMRCWNALVKEQLIYPEKTGPSPALLEAFKASCRPDREGRPDMESVELLSGARYMASEQFWAREFGGGPAAADLSALREESGEANAGRGVVPCRIERAELEAIASRFGAGLPEVLLVAYAALLSQLTDCEEVVLLADLGGESGVAPLRLSYTWGAGFGELLRQTRARLDTVAPHLPYAMHVLTNPLRMKALGSAAPTFTAAFRYAGPDAGRRTGDLAEVLENFPSVAASLGLTLEVEDRGQYVEARLSYLRGWFRPPTVEAFGSYLSELLEEIAGRPDFVLGEGAPEGGGEARAVEVGSLAGDEFNL
jgi:radical SAM PhpK family P-methyltransferase